MRIASGMLLCLLVSGVARAQNSSEPQLTSAQLPTYPVIARMAGIQGDVKVNFVLNDSGEPVSATPVSGPSLLWQAAVDNVRSWRFKLPKNVSGSEWSYSTTFHFKISADEDVYNKNPSKLTVIVNSFRDIEVITDRPSGKYAEDCPSDEEAKPPKSVDRGDFVKLSRSGCFGTCPVYEVTVSENGDVTWKGFGFVVSTGEKHSHVNPQAARALIQKFLEPEFWALCGGYSASVTDSATTAIEVHIGGRSKTVSNYADSAPTWVETFEKAIDATADTHLWRHGDPRKEPLSNIFEDAWLPKPGVTPLMRAAADADIAKMKALLASGAHVDAADSSGWTALMYAAASTHSKPVQLLLRAGANPNHRSFSGDTPLMASAITGAFDEDLFHAGAKVNEPNSQGVTILMVFAAKADPDEVKEALDFGANSLARDASGRSALDYLRLADCGKSPVIESVFGTTEGCGQMDPDDFLKVERMLTNASQKTKH
jgi:TonB family protein